MNMLPVIKESNYEEIKDNNNKNSEKAESTPVGAMASDKDPKEFILKPINTKSRFKSFVMPQIAI